MRPQLNRNRYCHTRVKNEFECDTDPVLVSSRVDIAVYAGHVLLVGLVDSRANVQKFISDASSVSGVVSVTSYIQTV